MATVLLLASFGTWGYVYSGFADRPPPDLLSSPTYATEAEQVCAAAVADVAAMPDALEATDGTERSEQIQASTERFRQMLLDLTALVDREAAGDQRDVEILNGWLADWWVLIGDRETYADAIAADPDAQFYLTDTGAGERLDRRISRMADTNEMYSCGTPEDVG